MMLERAAVVAMWTVTAAVVLTLLVPLAVTLAVSVSASSVFNLPPPALSSRWYERILPSARARQGDGAGPGASLPDLGAVRLPRLDGQLPDLDLPGGRAPQDVADPHAAVPRGESRPDDRRDLLGAHPHDHRRAPHCRPPRRASTPGRFLDRREPRFPRLRRSAARPALAWRRTGRRVVRRQRGGGRGAGGVGRRRAQRGRVRGDGRNPRRARPVHGDALRVRNPRGVLAHHGRP